MNNIVDSRLLHFLGALAFIAMMSFSTYKIILPLGLKIINLCLKSHRFSAGISFFLAICFCVSGIFQFNDFITEADLSLSHFFPLSFISSGLLLFVGFRNYKLIK